MMEIDENVAVDHIVTSLDNEYGSWYDRDNDVTWHIQFGGPGVIDIVLRDDDGENEVHSFRLVKTVS